MTPKRQAIINLSFEELRHQLVTGALTAVEVLMAFQAKAMLVHERTNAITGFIEEALDRARELDLVPENQRKPLHGLPISFKVYEIL
jgi:Asp-tRNA(Asn)/Glu-tRNA(Gln) amidotransferase A subunit family amidase